MTDTTNQISTKPKEQKVNLANGLGFFDNTMELVPDPQRLVANGGQFLKDSLGDIGNAVFDLVKGEVAGIEQGPKQRPKLAIGNQTEINFNNADEVLIKQQRAAIEEAERIVSPIDPNAAVAEAERIVQESSQARAEFIRQEEIRFEVAGMPEEERNKRLHLSTSFRKENTFDEYHEVELYRQAKEELREDDEQIRETSLAETNQSVVNMNAIVEGGTGGAKANISQTGGGAG